MAVFKINGEWADAIKEALEHAYNIPDSYSGARMTTCRISPMALSIFSLLFPPASEAMAAKYDFSSASEIIENSFGWRPSTFSSKEIFETF